MMTKLPDSKSTIVQHNEHRRGEIYWVYLDPTRGREQAGRRPVIILSPDEYHQAETGLVFIVPTTTKQRPFPSRFPLHALEGGLTKPSDALLDQIRSISVERLGKYIGSISPRTLRAITTRLRLLIDL